MLFGLDVVKILEFGAIGIGLLLAVLAYNLIRRTTPNPDTYKAISRFLWFSSFLCLVGLFSQIVNGSFQSSRCETERAAAKAEIERLTAEKQKLIDSRAGLSRVTGRIKSPASGGVAERSFEATGTAAGMSPGIHLWLAVEYNGIIFPRDAELPVAPNGTWTGPVFEDGGSPAISLSLIAADEAAHIRIIEWRKAREKGSTEDLRLIEGTSRLHRIDNLSIRRP